MVGEKAGRKVVIVGAGPAGLMVAETCVAQGLDVHVYDAMPSAGRKFLLAGLGGLNLTHSESAAKFLARYTDRIDNVAPWLGLLDADGLRQWAHGLGIDTFVGSSGRVFPAEMKAAPLLRGWLARLRGAGVVFHMRHRLTGLSADRRLQFTALAPRGEGGEAVTVSVAADAVVLACGGASWPSLGSDGAWTNMLDALGVSVEPLKPANCGFDVAWSTHFSERNAGQPVKNLRAWVTHMPTEAASAVPRSSEANHLLSTDAALVVDDDIGAHLEGLNAHDAYLGEMLVSATGLEGGLIYQCAKALRDTQQSGRNALLVLDLLPNHDMARVFDAIARPRGAKSWSSHLASVLGLKGVKASLLRECAPASAWEHPGHLAALIKRLPIRMGAPRPIAEVISSAGGVRFDAVDDGLQCKAVDGVFCAGEMLDWEAPTGGYLLTAVMASGRVAGEGVVSRLSGGEAAAASPLADD